MPRLAICAEDLPVISLPSRKTCPRDGVMKLVSRLKKVVFPAPLGPMIAWMSPLRTDRETSSTAVNPLKSLPNARASRMMSFCMSELMPVTPASERVTF